METRPCKKCRVKSACINLDVCATCPLDPLLWYVLSFQSADSYNSVKTYPFNKIFTNRKVAESFVSTQPGYGLGIDWNVEEWEILDS